MTIDELFEKYFHEYARFRCRSKSNIRANYQRYLAELKEKPVAALTRNEIRTWHLQLAEKCGEVTANRSLSLLRRLYNWGEEWDYLTCPNPTLKIKKFREAPRRRVVDENEMPILLNAIEKYGTPKTKEIFLICLYTAQRLDNVCAMSWNEIDFIRKVWVIPAAKFKTNVHHEVPLVDQAIEILIARRNGHQYVFPGHGNRKMLYISYPYAGWRKVLNAAGITNLNPHDLRRTHATCQSENDVAGAVTRDTLGHADETMTGKYSKPSIKKIRSAMQEAVNRMLG